MKKQVWCGVFFITVFILKAGTPLKNEGQEIVALKFLLPLDSFRQDGFDQELVRERMPAELVFDNVPRGARSIEEQTAMVLRNLLGESNEQALTEAERHGVFLFNEGSKSPIRVIFRSRSLVNKIYAIWERERQRALVADAMRMLEMDDAK